MLSYTIHIFFERSYPIHCLLITRGPVLQIKYIFFDIFYKQKTSCRKKSPYIKTRFRFNLLLKIIGQILFVQSVSGVFLKETLIIVIDPSL